MIHNKLSNLTTFRPLDFSIDTILREYILLIVALTLCFNF